MGNTIQTDSVLQSKNRPLKATKGTSHTAKMPCVFTANPKAAVREAEKLLAEKVHTGSRKTREITQGRMEFWCADAVNYEYEKASGKNPFGKNADGSYKYSNVAGLRTWGIQNKRFKPINATYNKAEINKQIKQFKQGDIIIWKSPYITNVEGSSAKQLRHASHTGIVQKSKNGYVYVIEGNANQRKKNKKGEYLLVKNDAEGTNGNQAIGDFQEVNRFDGMMLKKYNAQDLIDSGYSGYIDMQNF